MNYDIIIIGGGPAGMTAAIYALRANKRILVLEKEVIGGKIVSSPLVENYPGMKSITGGELAQNLYQQVTNLGGDIQMKEVITIKEENENKQVITKDSTYFGKTIIIATGTKYKMLGIAREYEFIGKGISFCATCDGFFYKNKIVAVIGGGNTAISNVIELSNICKKVYLIQILDKLTAESILIHRLQEKTNVEILYHSTVKGLFGNEKLKGIEIEQNGNSQILEVDGMFLSIGQLPESDIPILGATIEKNPKNYFYVNAKLMTRVKGIFAAGDCIDKEIRQLTTAVSDGTVAALNAINYLENLK